MPTFESRLRSAGVSSPLSPTTMRSAGIFGASFSLTASDVSKVRRSRLLMPTSRERNRKRAIEFGFVVNFEQHVHAEIEGGVLDVLGGRVVERRHDDQDAIGAPGARFRDLIDVEHEILAQGGKGGCVARLRQEFRLALE